MQVCKEVSGGADWREQVSGKGDNAAFSTTAQMCLVSRLCLIRAERGVSISFLPG